MCGLFGYVLVEAPKDLKLLTILGTSMATRGNDSWGLAAPSPGGGLVRRRALGSLGQAVSKVDDKWRTSTLLGHTRLSTCGKATIETAHPFSINRKLLAHNGIIYNSYDLEKKDGRLYPVDSQALLYRIAHDEDTTDIEGYGAVIYLDQDTQELHVARLREGDLEACFVREPRGTSGVVIASTLQPFHILQSKGWVVKRLPKLAEGQDYRVTLTGLQRIPRRYKIQASSWNYARYAGKTRWQDYADDSHDAWAWEQQPDGGWKREPISTHSTRKSHTTYYMMDSDTGKISHVELQSEGKSKAATAKK